VRVAVLGIDAAWTERNPSGFALIDNGVGPWRLGAAAPNLREFADKCGLSDEEGQGANFALRCAEKLIGRLPDLVAVDMPLSNRPIEGRRTSDIAVSRRFGAAKCATHSPSAERPGQVGFRLHEDCKARGYQLITSAPADSGRSLAEIYPHPALLRLMKVDVRLRYKIGKTGIYWPGRPSEERLSLVKRELCSIVAALDQVVVGAQQAIHGRFDFDGAKTFSALKPAEDTIDAIISAWIGTTILENAAEAFGDEDSAIWVPMETWARH
jgi:predicted RNase H-like nuclease